MNNVIQIRLRNCLITVQYTGDQRKVWMKSYIYFLPASFTDYITVSIPDFLLVGTGGMTHPLGGCHAAANTQIMLPICGRTARHNYLSLCYEYSTWRYLTKITSILYLGDPILTCSRPGIEPGPPHLKAL
jgi:hypothetical protein